GGTGPSYSALWSNGSTSFNLFGLAAGTYSVTITDQHSCTATASFTVNAAPAAIAANGQVFQPQCPGSTGGISINPSGGTGPSYSALWSNGSTSYNLIGLAAGTYSVTITDQNSCTATASFTVNAAPAAIAANGQVFQPQCPGSTGGISINPSGGTGPSYSALCINDSTSIYLFGLAAGTYSVTITDQHSCTATASFTVNAAPAAIAANGQVFQPQCPGSTGGISINPSGGTGPS